ncbi:Protein of unknown function [Gryllus bimaculatus]|nr:Protein of unknown function [Gryllus bimaculatus]
MMSSHESGSDGFGEREAAQVFFSVAEIIARCMANKTRTRRFLRRGLYVARRQLYTLATVEEFIRGKENRRWYPFIRRQLDESLDSLENVVDFMNMIGDEINRESA